MYWRQRRWIKMAKKLEQLYNKAKLKVAGDEITAMAERFGVRKEDVIFAVWAIAKDSVWAKLEQDLKEKKRRKRNV